MQTFQFSQLSETQLSTNLTDEVSQASGYEMWTGFDTSLRASLHSSETAFPLYGSSLGSSYIAYGERFYTYYAPAFLVLGLLFLAMMFLIFISTIYGSFCCMRTAF
jgi:hypothetical protein